MYNRQPNILLIIVDSLRADHLSCYGYHRKTTPHIDRLAAEGCLFETAITAAPFSPASYASLFSNMYPHQHGVNGDTVRVWPDTWPRLPELMRNHGYVTFCISNNSFLTPATNSARGFDAFVDLREPNWYCRQRDRVLGHIRRRLGDRCADSLASNAQQCTCKGDSSRSVDQAMAMIAQAQKPFFGALVLMDPHTPYRKSRTHFSGNCLAVRRFLRCNNHRTMWVDLMAARSGLSDRMREIANDLYDGETRYVDACIGRLAGWLKDRALIENTIIAVTSDHGEAFGDRGVWGHGFGLNDCLTRVPLVLRHPDYWSPGTKCNGLVQLHDIHDLCMSVADTGIPRTTEYPHCLTQANDPAWGGREVVFSEFPRQSKTLKYMRDRNPDFQAGVWEHHMWAVRSAEWRYIEYDNTECELYHLSGDPAETVSVHEQYPARCAEFAKHLARHKTDGVAAADRPEEPEQVDEVVLERLRSLGYIE